MEVVVLVSGRGSNLAALLAAQRDGTLPIRITAVLCDRPAAPALAIARDAGVPTCTLDAAEFDSRVEFDRALFAHISSLAPQLVVLAGFMRIIDASVLTPWLGRMINIHPSLLPKYSGLHTHRRALEAGDPEHGASVHFVTAELDGGPVIAQVAIEVHEDDNTASLAARLLAHEHDLLVASVGLIASGRLRYAIDGPQLDDHALLAPLRLIADRSRRFLSA